MVLDTATMTRVGLGAVVVIAVLFGISLVGRDRFVRVLTDRFIYGVPWGSLVVIVGVFAFYLFAQSGLQHWHEPVTLPFRNWAYPYATGMFTSGFAHNSPSHLLGNMLATVVLAPLAEFIWGHYPHDGGGTRRPGQQRTDSTVPETPDPTEFDTPPEADAVPSGPRSVVPAAETVSSGKRQVRDEETQQVREPETRRLRDRPVVRALVIFPGVVVLVSLLTSFYALGWSLGFSGTVFAFLGFVLLRYPIATAVALLGVSLLNTLLNAVLTPVLRAGVETGPPRPPGWAGVNVQAHMLGFLIGVLLALLLLWYRDEQPSGPRLFLATVLVAAVQGLWQLATRSGGEFLRYQGLGVIFVLLLAIIITYVMVNENVTLTGWTPPVLRGIGALWVVVVAIGAVVAFSVLDTSLMLVLSVTALVPILLLPGATLVVPDILSDWPMTTRRLLFVGLVVITVVIALPSVAGNAVEMDDDAIPGESVTVDDYHVNYAENVSHGRTGTTESGLIGVSEQRYIWSVAVTEGVLAHEGTETVPLGDIGWRETVEAERTGWNVVGNDSVYVVDLKTDDEEVRSFNSSPSQAAVTLSNSTIKLVPTDDEFLINVTQDGEQAGSTPLPPVNETAAVGTLEFVTVELDGTPTLLASTADSRLVIAEKE